MNEKRLTLDVTDIGRGSSQAEVARIAVGTTAGLTRQGDATLTSDCRTSSALEHEIAVLKAELDEIAAELRERWGDAEAAPSDQESPEQAQSPARPESERPSLDHDLTVRDVMTREIKTVGRNEMLSVADDLMKVGRFRHVVVVEEDGRLAGVVSQRDLFYGALAWSLGQGSEAHQRSLEALPVKQVMTTNLAVAEPDLPLARAAALMVEHKVGCLPVIEHDQVVGILTEGDFLALLA
ncbi:MAG: CBS domain-containing protein [bacterium]|nr:CBS domain-containing protein [bacterium]